MAVEGARLRSIDDLPEPPGLPLIGNAYEILRSMASMHRTFEKWAETLRSDRPVQSWRTARDPRQRLR